MFVYSVKSSRLKLIALIAFVVLAVAAMIFLARDDTPAASDGGISLKAGNSSERIAFLSQFGWEISEDPVEVAEVIIPAEFDDAYEKYNDIQKKQNLDLSKYCGKRAKRWTYEIKNYPGYENKKGFIQANMLIYDGMVIGGDICSVELNGFMNGFDFPEIEVPTTSADTSAPKTSPTQTTAKAG
ncbi:MAG: DUF4830 domain-containing protein [Clostridiales bacterium]|jgi:hypothetical protein|nr:DUF4830 domain-containing protein [Clostridiales bacterium]